MWWKSLRARVQEGGLLARAAWELGGDLDLLQVGLTNKELDALLPEVVGCSGQRKEAADFFLTSRYPLYPFQRNAC